MKRVVQFSGLLIVFFYLLFFPENGLAASSRGLMLWFHTILPALLPFLILSDLLISSGFMEKALKHTSSFFHTCFGLSVYGGYALAAGIFCGYPMGARTTADLYKKGQISLQEASYLLTFSNNPGPAFILNYVLLHTPRLKSYALLTFIILYLSCFFTSRVFYHLLPGDCSGRQICTCSASSKNNSPGISLDHSVMNGLETVLRIGGYLIFFSVISSMILHVLHSFPLPGALLSGMVEITTGIDTLSTLPVPLNIKYLVILGLLSFGGISTIEQTRGMLNGTPLSIHTYIAGKIVHTGLTLLIGSLLLFVT